MKGNRLVSFIILLFIYIISAVIGYISYFYLPYAMWLNLLISDIISTVIVFIFSLIFKNASVYDPYWSVAPIIIVIIALIKSPFNACSLLASISVILWGLRLTLNWAYTFKDLNHLDWRYVMLKEKTKKLYPFVNFIGIHLVPTLVVYLCVLPLITLIKNGGNINVFSIIFLILSVISFTIQGIADIEMHKFRKNKNGVCNNEVNSKMNN